jgi:DNA-binding response OmpR family regulator
MGLDLGGDDYVTKPFKLNELLSEINSTAAPRGAVQAKRLREIASKRDHRLLEESRAKKDGHVLDLTVQDSAMCLLIADTRTGR